MVFEKPNHLSTDRSLMGFKAALNMMEADAKKLFFKKTAKDIIWGYDDSLSSFARYTSV